MLRIITNSERSSSACWRRHDYRYGLGIVPTGEAPSPLRQGSLVHRMLGAMYRGDLARHPHEIMNSLRAEVAGPWLEQRIAAITDRRAHDTEEQLAEVKRIGVEAFGMVEHYAWTFAAVDHAEWEILGVDVPVARRLQHPDHGGWLIDRPADGIRQLPMPGVSAAHANAGRRTRSWWFAGEIDMIVRERSTGLVWIVEHKTTDGGDLQGYCRRLHLDPQVRGYLWALTGPPDDPDNPAGAVLRDLRYTKIGAPIEPAGVIYNVLRKAVPREPPPLKPRKPGGPSPGVSQAAIVTTPAVYLAAVLRHGHNPDDYADKLAELRGVQFFHRDRYVISRPQLLDWHRDTGIWALQAQAEERRREHPRQTQVCQGVVQMPCPYQALCLEDTPGAREHYQLRGVRHEELPGALGDPWPVTDARRNAFAGASDHPRHPPAVADWDHAPDPFAG